MLRTSLSVFFATAATSAIAHSGHIADIGHGHSHFTTVSVLAVLGIATTIAIRQRFFS